MHSFTSLRTLPRVLVAAALLRALAGLALVVTAACAPGAQRLDAQHPANPDARAGRLAGPPAALRPGVADGVLEEPPRTTAPAMDPHAGRAPAATDPHAGHAPAAADPHAGHTPAAQPAAPEKPAADAPADPPAKKPAAKKPAAKKPAPKKPVAPPAAPNPPAKPPVQDHSGHGGHGHGS